MFTQGFVVLTERKVELDELRPLVPEFPFLRTVPAGEHWEMGGETAVVAFRAVVNGTVLIDTVDHVWPDHMGDPKQEPMLMGAWAMGHFGPFAYPHGLRRAVEHAWSWPEAKERVPMHRAFLRLRTSYVMGAGPDAKILPPDYHPRAELDFLTDLVRGVLRHSAAISYFNPSGEVVAPAEAIDKNVTHHREHDLPPLNVWANIRLFNLPGDWLMMDSVGNWQLDLPDIEVAFPKGAFAPADIDYFIRNTTLYRLQKGPVLQDGDTLDGPGGKRFQGRTFKNGLNDPPREVLSWLPVDARDIPGPILERARHAKAAPAAAPPKKRPWWKPW